MENKVYNIFRRKLVIGMVLLFVCGSFFPSICANIQQTNIKSNYQQNIDTFGNTWYVNDTNTEGPWDGTPEHPFQYIQDGVDAANDGDEIRVYNGTYNEGIDITKEIKLIGGFPDDFDFDGSIINGTYADIGFYIHSMDVTTGEITGFTIQNCGFGIFIDYSSYITISENIIENNYRGIFIFHSNNGQIKRNIIQDNEWVGINLEATDHTIITENCIRNNKYGIVLSDTCFDNKISLNSIENNSKYGIVLVRSFRNDVYQNNFIENTVQATFYSHSWWNSFSDNYWSDKKENLPVYIIWGRFTLLRLPPVNIIIPKIDWRPSSIPYDIWCEDTI